MSGIDEIYMREIAAQWSYLPTWLPGRTVRLGQTGTFDGTQVNVESDLANEGIAFSQEHDESETELEYHSAGAVSYGWTVGAAIATGERAQLQISFSRENAIVLDACGAVEHRITNLKGLKEEILTRDGRSQWPKRRAVIVSVVHAKSTTVLISSANDSSVTCEANAGQALGNLADPRLELKRSAARSMQTAIISDGDFTPIHQALVLRKGLFGSRTLEGALRGPETMDASDPLREVIDEDFALCAVAARAADQP
jgi:hypothetical protein